MGANASGPGPSCRGRNHYGKSMAIYDDLPREVRDKIKIAPTDLCCVCIRNKLRRSDLDVVLSDLDFQRRYRREKRGREVWKVPQPELKP